jgi:hypothetical protein
MVKENSYLFNLCGGITTSLDNLGFYYANKFDLTYYRRKDYI